MKRLLSCILIVAVVFGSLSAFAQDEEKKGKLDAFEEEVAEDKENEEAQPAGDAESAESRYSEDEDQSRSFWADICFGIFKFLFYITFIGPTDSESLYGQQFSNYPYETPDVGLYSSHSGRNLSCNLYGHYLYHSTDLHGLALRGQLLPLPFLGLEADLCFFQEKMEKGADHLHLLNLFVNYHRVRIERWTFWWGLGSKGIIGEDSHFGVAMNLGTLIYPVQPVSLKAEYNFGTIQSASVQELLLQLNCHVRRNVFFLGYHKHRAGSADLDGFIAGYGVHF